MNLNIQINLQPIYPVRIGFVIVNPKTGTQTLNEYPYSGLDLYANANNIDKIQSIDSVLESSIDPVNGDSVNKGRFYYSLTEMLVPNPGLQCANWLNSDSFYATYSGTIAVDINKCPSSLTHLYAAGFTAAFSEVISVVIPVGYVCYRKKYVASTDVITEGLSPRCCYRELTGE